MAQTNLKIDGERLWGTLMESAQFGATPKGGIRRLSLSDEDKAVRDWFGAACHDLGLELTVDEVGNMFATRPGTDPSRATIAFGSHLDTQPAGGKFDGILGVLAGLEALRTLKDAGYETAAPLTLVNWTNEEGARFAPAMMCSGVWAGELDKDTMMAGTDNDGRIFGEELQRIGYRGEEPVGERRFGAFVELHIEQGPILETEEKTIGIVEGGQGVAWFDGVITGRDSHAGTTPMDMRADAFCALAEVASAVETIALSNMPGLATIGEVSVLPGSRNTIPGEARFKLDTRHPDAAALSGMEEAIHAKLNEIAARRGVEISMSRVWRKDPLAFHPTVVEAVAGAAEKNGIPARRITSGAGHDAIYIAGTCPTGMIFIPCWKGISHNEEESAEKGDCAAGAQVLLDTLLALDAAGDVSR